jgi:hypothetical protein
MVEASGDNGATVQASGNDFQEVLDEVIHNREERIRDEQDDYPRPGVAWGNIIRDTLKIRDPAGLAKRLRAELTIEDQTSYGQIVNSLNRAANNYYDAGRLYRAAKIERDEFESILNERFEVMRTDVTKELMAEYKLKLRRSPTKDDIEDRIISKWPSEYKTLKKRLSELHGAVRSLEVLMKAWQSRGADLRVMAERVRARS